MYLYILLVHFVSVFLFLFLSPSICHYLLSLSLSFSVSLVYIWFPFFLLNIFAFLYAPGSFCPHVNKMSAIHTSENGVKKWLHECVGVLSGLVQMCGDVVFFFLLQPSYHSPRDTATSWRYGQSWNRKSILIKSLYFWYSRNVHVLPLSSSRNRWPTQILTDFNIKYMTMKYLLLYLCVASWV